jgi:hypothetical protein
MRADDSMHSRVYLSIGHLKNTAHFARLTGEIEHHVEFSWGTFKPHEANAMGAVLSSVAFLEAAVNELYADAAEDSHPSEIMRSIGEGYAIKMPKRVRDLLAGLWGTERFRVGARTLEKYDTALRMAGAARFDRGAQPYQDVALLIQLRNALIHFGPQSHHEGEEEPTRFETKLKGKFPLNPLAAPINPLGNDPMQPFLPDKCLGYGCAMWALESSVEFTEEFFSRMGLKASHGGWLVEMAVEYASMLPLEEIAAKHGARAEHLVEHPVEAPPGSCS